MATVQNLVDAAMRDIGAIGSGDSPSATESSDALVKLNQMLASWSAQGLPIYSLTKKTVALTGAASYTLVGADRPVKIKAAAVLSTATVDMPIPVLNAQEWAAIQDKAGTADFAEGVYLADGYPLATLYVAPKPSAGTLILHSQKAIGSGLMEVRDTVALGGAASYTWGVGGAIAVERPVKILAASIAAGSSITRGLRIVPAEEWASYPKKGVGGNFAEVLYCDYAYPDCIVYLGPKAANGGTLELYNYIALTAFATLATTIALPPGYERALRSGLALELYPEYPRESGIDIQMLVKNAEEAKASVFGLNQAVLGGPQPVPSPQVAPVVVQAPPQQ